MFIAFSSLLFSIIYSECTLNHSDPWNVGVVQEQAVLCRELKCSGLSPVWLRVRIWLVTENNSYRFLQEADVLWREPQMRFVALFKCYIEVPNPHTASASNRPLFFAICGQCIFVYMIKPFQYLPLLLWYRVNKGFCHNGRMLRLAVKSRVINPHF